MDSVRWFWTGTICGAALAVIIVILRESLDNGKKAEEKDGSGKGA